MPQRMLLPIVPFRVSMHEAELEQWDLRIRYIPRLEIWRTHILFEGKPPTLVPPWLLCHTLELDQELPLEVQQIFQAGKEKVDCLAIKRVHLCRSLRVFLHVP